MFAGRNAPDCIVWRWKVIKAKKSSVKLIDEAWSYPTLHPTICTLMSDYGAPRLAVLE